MLIFLFKMLHRLSFSSSNFEFLNMHISLGNFSRHMCDVIGVNRSMKRERSIIKSHYKQMNDHNRIINCTMVYREAIGYTNMHRKGSMWEEFSCILPGYGAEESMDNILQTQDLCTYEESSSVF